MEGQLGEYIVTEFPAVTGLLIEEDLLGIEAAPVEGWFEQHMVTEFSTGVVTLDDEFFSAIDGTIVVEEALPVLEEALPLMEEAVVTMEEIAPVIEETYPVIEEMFAPKDELGVPAIEEEAVMGEGHGLHLEDELAPAVEEGAAVGELMDESFGESEWSRIGELTY